jgi:hypothetical protein
VQARAAEGESFYVDTAPWVALQRVLALEGPLYQVVIPFAQRLSSDLPTKAVVMRRAYPHLLTVIRAFAVLRQHQRERDARGRLIATAADYREARWLLEEVFTTTASDGLTPATRETVQAVQSNHDLVPDGQATSETKLAEILGLARQSIQYRVARAIDKGWLQNTAGKYQKKVLWPAADLPEGNVLPTVEHVCNEPPENDSALRQSGSGTASSPAPEGAELSAEDLPTAEGLPNAEEVPNGHSAGSAGSSSPGEQSAELPNENPPAVHTHEDGSLVVEYDAAPVEEPVKEEETGWTI